MRLVTKLLHSPASENSSPLHGMDDLTTFGQWLVFSCGQLDKESLHQRFDLEYKRTIRPYITHRKAVDLWYLVSCNGSSKATFNVYTPCNSLKVSILCHCSIDCEVVRAANGQTGPRCKITVSEYTNEVMQTHSLNIIIDLMPVPEFTKQTPSCATLLLTNIFALAHTTLKVHWQIIHTYKFVVPESSVHNLD